MSNGLISTAHTASEKAHHEGTKEAHEQAQKAHEAVVEHLSKHGDGLGHKTQSYYKALEHKYLAEASGLSGAAKLSSIAEAKSTAAQVHGNRTNHIAAHDAHLAASQAHLAEGNDGKAAGHDIFAKGHLRNAQNAKESSAALHADHLSTTAKTPTELIAAAKAHYAVAQNGKSTVALDSQEYKAHVIKAHAALMKLDHYPPNENGHPIHPASWADHHYGAHIANLPKGQQTALSNYSGTKTCENTNRALREGKKPPTVTKQLDAALGSARTPEPLTVTRTLATLPEGLHVGARFTDPAYMSTSIHHGGTVFRASDHIMEIHIPKGSPGLAIRGISTFRHEEEFLLPRSTRLQIDHIEKRGDKTYIKATVVHD